MPMPAETLRAHLTEAFPGMSYITKPCLEDDFDRVLGERHDR